VAKVSACHSSSRYPVRGSAPPIKGQLGADLLEFLNATNERAADESRHVHA
jgi:hypothetical protein